MGDEAIGVDKKVTRTDVTVIVAEVMTVSESGIICGLQTESHVRTGWKQGFFGQEEATGKKR